VTITLSYVYRGLYEDANPVVNVTNDKISKPYEDQKVTIVKNYYDKDGEEQAQQSALIYYENTYMPNTGVLYGSDETFDVISCLDGTVEDITADEIMGNIVTIKNSNNLTTIYQSLNEVKVLVGDTIKQGDVIGTSGSNKIDSTKENMLLFEVSYNGEYINPETFYTKNINELE
jgi:stage II sporulation protein Q